MSRKMEDNNRIIKTEYSEVMQKSYIDYAMSVIVARALPDVRDGLKPVQRRTLMICMSSASGMTNRIRKARVSSVIRWVNIIRTATARFTKHWSLWRRNLKRAAAN